MVAEVVMEAVEVEAEVEAEEADVVSNDGEQVVMAVSRWQQR
jgi:hypothetical protein